MLLAVSQILRGNDFFFLIETSTADQTWLQQVVMENSRPFRALQLQVKQGERGKERESRDSRKRERESRERERVEREKVE